MKKRYFAPEEEFIVFYGNEVFFTDNSGTCQTYCKENETCQVCDYLVCEPRDVIIGKVPNSSRSSQGKKSVEGPKNAVGFDMTFDR